ncbi:hypothetical protein JA9_001509 [Meyerozyma sp. JA9]|nr:hypothetical protein JA9_001509 [Meyerozyma sp. JA9]
MSQPYDSSPLANCDNYVNGDQVGHGYDSVYSFGSEGSSSVSEGNGEECVFGGVAPGPLETSLVGKNGFSGGSVSSISEIPSTQPSGVVSGSLTPESDSSSQRNSSQSLVWVDHSHDAMAAKTAGDEVDSVRKRLEKRKRRNAPKTSPVEVASVTKRTRNTLAARRYRQRRQEEVEILDTKVRELEQEVAKAKLEAQWWQMEAQRWKEMAKRGGAD